MRSKLAEQLLVSAIVLTTTACDLGKRKVDPADEYQRFVSERNSCTSNEECVLAGGGCPLGCGVGVRPEYEEALNAKASELRAVYEKDGQACKYKCPVQHAECRNGRCTAVPGPSARAAESPVHHAVLESFQGIETEVGGRLGIFALDLATGQELAHRADETFALCSTFKWLLAAEVLFEIDHGRLGSEELVPYGAADVLEYAPVARQHLKDGALSVDALAAAAVGISDNTAANLLLARVGGPKGFTEFLRSLGDQTTRLDRTEPLLNTNFPGDPSDTTSPRSMVGLARVLLTGTTLSPSSRQRLIAWLVASPTGKNRIRAGVPPDWKVGDKTGSCNQSTIHDVAIIWPPGREPVLLAIYLSEASAPVARLEEAHARVAQLVVREFTR